jgi:flagellum-specific ATP synthase
MQHVPVGRQMLGRVVDGMGRPIDRDESFAVEAQYPVHGDPPAPLSRLPIDTPVPTGVRAIDLMLTLGGGQRVGVFAGTGVGKSVLMGMIARNTEADVSVVALVGERGREVGDFLRKDLGEAGLERTVMVVSTGDESPVMRVRACFLATAVAEYFRDLGRDVLLLMDSTTRMAAAQRQIGLAAGEPPATKGYPPSVFALLPRLLERAGKTERGSITGLYTVLVEGDDISEPIADAIRGTLDGHVWLSRELANRGHYPAVSVLESISRVMPDLISPEHLAAAQTVKRVLAVWADIEDLVNIGAYAAGTNAEFDLAVQMKPRIDELLKQGIRERAPFAESGDKLLALNEEIASLQKRLEARPRSPAPAPA